MVTFNKCDIERVEKIQWLFTKWLLGLKDLTYSQRLKVLDLESLELRRLYADRIMCYKIVFGLVNLSFFSDFFAFSPSTVTRGHQYKICVNHSRGARKYFFAERVGPWNSLSTNTDFGTLKRFKLSIKSIDFQKFVHIEC